MGKIIILNGSPRAPRSNSARYAGIFRKYAGEAADYFEITRKNHEKLCSMLEEYTDVLFVFPLYADAIPATLLNFLKDLENYPVGKKPVVSVLINCGFLEYTQNDTAVRMMKLFCKQNGFPWGSLLEIGSGEAILDSPFRFLAAGKIKRFSRSVCSGNYASFRITMPLPRSLFLRAAEKYWVRYGKKHGVSKEEMQTMKIE